MASASTPTLLQRDHAAEDRDVAGRHDRRKRRGLRAKKLFDRFLDADGERHGGDRERQHAVTQHRIDQQHLEAEAQQQKRQQDADQNRKPERRAYVHHRQHQECRQHDEFALREIDGLRGLPQ
jgi:hypothetical protein